MALSVGLLSTIIMFLIIVHAGSFVAYYFHRRKQSPTSARFTLTGQTASRLHWLMVILIVLAFILGCYAAASCNFIIAKIPNLYFNRDESLDWGIGFSHMYMPLELASRLGQDGGCESFDTNTELFAIYGNSTAKSFAIFNCLLTTVGVVAVFLLMYKTTLMARRDLIWLNTRIIMYISLWCAILSFYLKENGTCDENPCSLGGPGYVQIVNVIFLMIVNFVLFFTNPGKERWIQSCFLSAEEARRRSTIMTPDANVTDDPAEFPDQESMATPGMRKSTALSSKA